MYIFLELYDNGQVDEWGTITDKLEKSERNLSGPKEGITRGNIVYIKQSQVTQLIL